MRDARRVDGGPRWLLGQLGLIALGVVVYFGVRGLTDGRPSLAIEHAREVVAFERRFGLEHEALVQSVVVRHEWLTDVANWVYIWGHWPLIAVVLLWLALRHRVIYLRLRNAMMISGSAGLVFFASYPVAPPRLSSLGLVDTVTKHSDAYRVLQPPAFVNQYAALPSLHVGWDLLVGIAVVTAGGSWWLRWLGRLMPALMAWAVVATANHYLVDGMLGAVFALSGLYVAVLLERRREAPARPSVGHLLPAPRPAPDDPYPVARSASCSIERRR